MFWLLCLYLTALGTLQGTYGYPGGAPSGVCDSMVPGHGTSRPKDHRTSPPPFSIVFPGNLKALKPAQDVQIHLIGTGGVKIKGFMITARKVGNDITPQGSFLSEESASKGATIMSKPLDCNDIKNSAMTHTNGDQKDRVTLSWRAPMTPGKYLFIATFLQSYDIFWVNVTSSIVTVVEDPHAPTSTTSKPLHLNIQDFYEGCGLKYSCHGQPEKCEDSKNCDLMFMWTARDFDALEGFQDVRIQMNLIGNVSVIPGENHREYIAVGISGDDKKGDDNLFICYMNRKNETIIQEFISEERRTDPLEGGIIGAIVSRHVTEFKPVKPDLTFILCEFSINEVIDPSGKYAAEQSLLNLTSNDVHLYLQRGRHADENGPSYRPGEVEYFNVSKQAYRLGDKSASHFEASTDLKKTSDMMKKLGMQCGKTKGCISIPDNCMAKGNCQIFATFNAIAEGPKKGKIDVQVYGVLKEQGYAAIGLSHDQKMGDDAVFGCYWDGSKIDMGDFYNIRKERYQNLKIDKGYEIMHKDSRRKINNFIHCQFQLKPFINLTEEIKTTFDLYKQRVYLFLALGDSASKEGLGYHTGGKASSTTPTLMSSKVILSTEKAQVLPAVHGSLMIIAWILLATIGQFTARYYKDTCSSMMFLGRCWWFVIHQSCMILAVLITLISVIIIFIDVGTYSAARAESVEENWHPILGLILTCIAVIQLLCGILRPDLDSEFRAAFNWGHWIAGTVCHWLGIACIFLANGLGRISKLRATSTFFDTVAIFVILHMIMHAIISLHTFTVDNPSLNFRGVAAGPQKRRHDEREVKKGIRIRMGILLVETTIAAACSVALIFEVASTV